MRTETRRERILERLRQDGQVQVRDLVMRFGVSEMTIRRDLEYLAGEGQLLRTYGGAMLATGPVREQPYVEKAAEQTAEKARIALHAAQLVQDGQVILLDAGSTTAAVARALRGHNKDLTVVTIDLKIALELCDEPNIRVLVTGGTAQPHGYNLYGPLVEQTLRGLTVDIAFLGTSAVDVEQGITTPTLEKVPLKQAMLRAARRSVLVANATKFGRRSSFQISPLAGLARIISDTALAPDVARAIRKEGIALDLV